MKYPSMFQFTVIEVKTIKNNLKNWIKNRRYMEKLDS